VTLNIFVLINIFVFNSATERYDWTSYLSWGSWIVDLFAYFNLVSDLKVASPELIAKRSIRTGDGSRNFDSYFSEPEVWEENKIPINSDHGQEWSYLHAAE
jgi:hypothetical protein